MKTRDTRRKQLIRSELKMRSSPLLLTELRAHVHRREMLPTTFKDFRISDTYAHSFNRTVRGMLGEHKTYKIVPKVDRLFIGLVARILIMQCLKKGLLRKFPSSGALPELVLFLEKTTSSIPMGPIIEKSWVSGVVLSSKGKVRHISSALASYQPTFVSTRPPTWSDLRLLAQVPWKLSLLTKEGIKPVEPTALLRSNFYHGSGYVSTFKINENIQIDRQKTRPPRLLVLPPLRRAVQKRFHQGVSFIDSAGDLREHAFSLKDEVPIVIK